jgi:hypothetical protein
VKRINTLVQDIYDLFQGNHTFDEKNVQEFTEHLATKLKYRLGERTQKPTLRLSNLGSPCVRKLWYSINCPELAEELPSSTKIKFIFGDILESLLLWLAKEAGHTVEGEQDKVSVNGVVGHRDAIIDGVVVDTKSASVRSFDKFKSHLNPEDDSFGYITQLGAYLAASVSEDIVHEKDIAAFLVINKEKGDICLDIHPSTGEDYHARVDDIRSHLNKELPPERPFTDVKDGESGNRKLRAVCGYCSFKYTCWPGLRTFLYSKGPVFLTRVSRTPKVTEVDRKGNRIDTF